MANNKDIDKILQDIKSKKHNDVQSVSNSQSDDTNRLKEIIQNGTSSILNADESTSGVQHQNTINSSRKSEINNEFFSKLATSLNEVPATSNKPEDMPYHEIHTKSNSTIPSSTTASYVDEKFVDFFTQSIAVTRQPTSDVVVKRKKHGFFKKKYITDSLTLSIPEEEIEQTKPKDTVVESIKEKKKSKTNSDKKSKINQEQPLSVSKNITSKSETNIAPVDQNNYKKSDIQKEKHTYNTNDVDSIIQAINRKKASSANIVAQINKPDNNTKEDNTAPTFEFTIPTTPKVKKEETTTVVKENTKQIVDEKPSSIQTEKSLNAISEQLQHMVEEKISPIVEENTVLSKKVVYDTTCENKIQNAQKIEKKESSQIEQVQTKAEEHIESIDQDTPAVKENIPCAAEKVESNEKNVVKDTEPANQNTSCPVEQTENEILMDTTSKNDENSPISSTSVPSVEDNIENTGYININSIEELEKNSVNDIQKDITNMFSTIETVAIDNEKIQEEEKIRRVFFQNYISEPYDENDENDEDDEDVYEEELENDFITQRFSTNPEEILQELKSFKFTLAIRMALSGICGLVLFYLNMAATAGFPVPEFINPQAQPVIFYAVNLVFYIIAIVGFLPSISNGLTGFIKAPTQDSFIVFPAILSFIQLNVLIFESAKIDVERTTIFAGFTVIAFGFNAIGKYINSNTILKNLSLADVPEGINAGYLIDNFEDVKRLSRTLDEKNIEILVSRKTGYISNFITGGFSSHSSEKHAKILSILSIVVSVICFIITYMLSSDFIRAIFAATGASIFMLPLSHSLVSSVPSSLMQKSLNKVGALVNGWQGIYQLSNTTHVSFDAKHLFPKGCVVLHGIKTFEKERLDLAILYAASIAIEYCDNLRPVFMTVIDNKKDLLFPIESCEYKIGQGYVAWIEHNRVIMGNRTIMEEYDVELPPISLETKYISEGKKPIYLSVNGKLFGMFVVSYHADKNVKENLTKLIENGKNIILQSNDFNIDSQLLELVYKLPEDTVQVLNKNETNLLLNYTQYSESTDCSMAHLDSLHSLAAGFFGADSAKRAASTCALLQIISVIGGAILAILFTFSQTICEISLLSALFLSIGWLFLSIVRALATKYF